MSLLLFWGIDVEVKAQIPIEGLNKPEFSESFETRYVPSENMNPTLVIGDRLLINKKIYQTTTPQRKDLVIFNPTETLVKQDYNQPFVSRIIGLPGETIEVKDGKVYIDRQFLEEDYIESPPAYVYGPTEIPSGSYFVLGDNRNNSYDSHFWGFVPEANIYGQITAIYCPLDRQQTLTGNLSEDGQQTFSTIRNFFQENPELCDLELQVSR